MSNDEAAKKWMRQIRHLCKLGMLSAGYVALHAKYVRSRWFRCDEVTRNRTMTAKGWSGWPCEKMFPPDGSLEVR